MKELVLPEHYSYIGAFLTMRCQLQCSYCINRNDGIEKYDLWQRHRKEMNALDWIDVLNRIPARDDLPITLQGGEPTVDLPRLAEIVNHVDKPMDLLTNLQCDVVEFRRLISPRVFKRNAPYASIRVSFHPEEMSLLQTMMKIIYLQDKGYQIGLYAVEHPGNMYDIQKARNMAEARGVDFRVKEFLGTYNGKMHGTYKYPEGVNGIVMAKMCRSHELLIAPSGRVYQCHGKLYGGYGSLGSMLDEDFEIVDVFRKCEQFGRCSPCDVKLKTNRFQEMGYCGVEIMDCQEE